MDEQEINTLYTHLRNEKIKLLESRKRKISKNGTSSSGSIGEKRQKQNGDESVQIVSSSSHDTKDNDRGSNSKDVGNKLVEDNNESHDSINDLLESASGSQTRPNTPQSSTRHKAPESNPDSSTMPNTTESYSKSHDPWGLDRSTTCSESTWGSSDQIDIEVTSNPPTRQNSPISQRVNKTYPTSKSSH